MKKAILFLLTLCGAIPMLCQTPLAPPLPAGTNYWKGMIVSSTGVGVIGCTNMQYILADGSGCGTPSGGGPITPTSINTSDLFCPVGANATTCYNTAKSYAVSGHAVILDFADSTYTITSPITLTSGIKTRGVIPRLTDCAPNLNSCETPNGGTWFACSTGCFSTPGGATFGVNGDSFEDVGFENWIGTALLFGSPTTVGCNNCYFHNVYFYGTPGSSGNTGNGPSDVAIWMYNSQIVPMDNITAINTNTIINDLSVGSTGSIPGNAVRSGIAVQTYVKSVANGNNGEAAITQQANLVTYVRPQINSLGDQTGTSFLIEAPGVTVIGADLETQSQYSVDVESVSDTIDINECFNPPSGGAVLYVGLNSINNTFQSECPFGIAFINNGNANTNTFIGSWQFASGSLIGNGPLNATMNAPLITTQILEGQPGETLYLAESTGDVVEFGKQSDTYHLIWNPSLVSLYPDTNGVGTIGQPGQQLQNGYFQTLTVSNQVETGATAIWRCTTAGTILPVGTLTTVQADCGASTYTGYASQ